MKNLLGGFQTLTMNNIGNYKICTDSTEHFMAEAHKYPALTNEEALSLVERAQNGDESARTAVINGTLRLVISEAKKRTNRGCLLCDLISVGMQGVDYAIGKFDSSKGCKFTTHATTWICKFMMEEIENNGRAIRLPSYMLERSNKILKGKEEFVAKYEREPSSMELSEFMGGKLSKDEIDEVWDLNYRTNVDSLDRLINEDCALYEIVPDKCEDESNSDSDEKASVKSLLDCLDERSAYIIKYSFGLGDGLTKTYEEIGNDLGIGTERVRQLRNQAIKQMQQNCSDPRCC